MLFGGAATSRREGEAGALARGEEEAVGSFRDGWGARPSSLYNARASWRPKFEVQNSAIARAGYFFFSRAGLAPSLEERGRVPAC
jgi:hypothetical protein